MNSNTKNPKVSAIIPTYNCEKYLPDAIESIQKQTYKDFEIIVIDDGSIDNTKQVINSCKENIRYFYQENKGVSSARNKGILEARGQYIAFLDSDDIMLPDMLEKLVEIIEKGYDWVFPRLYYRQILSDGKRGMTELKSSPVEILSDVNVLYKTLLKKFVGSIRGLARKDVFDKIGLFNKNFSGCEDQDIWLRFCKEGLKPRYIEGPLYIWGSHEKSLTIKSSVKTLIANYKFRKKYRKEAFKIDTKNRYLYSDIFWDIGREAFYLKKYMFFINCAINSQLCNPSFIRLYNSLNFFLKQPLNKNELKTRLPINTAINQSKKNILFITTAKKLFGSENSLLAFTSNLNTNYVPIVIFPEEGELSSLFNKNGIKTLILDLNSTSWFKRIFTVWRTIKKYNIALVHVNYHSDLRKVFLATKLSRVPIIVHFRMTGEISLSEFFRFKIVDKVICVSESVRNDILKTRRLKGFLPIRLKNLEVIHDGTNLEFLNAQANKETFRNEFGLKNTKAIGIVGAIAPRKRQDLFVKTAFEILQKNKNVKFFIVGDLYGDRDDGYRTYVKNLVKNLGLTENIIFTGRRNDIANVMKGLDILLVLSEHEAFGCVIIEAMAVGTPVVAIAIDGVKEVLGNNEGGLLVYSEDQKIISEKVMSLIENRFFYQQLSQKAKIRVKRFDIKNQVARISKLYNILLKAPL